VIRLRFVFGPLVAPGLAVPRPNGFFHIMEKPIRREQSYDTKLCERVLSPDRLQACDGKIGVGVGGATGANGVAQNLRGAARSPIARG
jgi:hypothetical protein